MRLLLKGSDSHLCLTLGVTHQPTRLKGMGVIPLPELNLNRFINRSVLTIGAKNPLKPMYSCVKVTPKILE